MSGDAEGVEDNGTDARARDLVMERGGNPAPTPVPSPSPAGDDVGGIGSSNAFPGKTKKGARLQKKGGGGKSLVKGRWLIVWRVKSPLSIVFSLVERIARVLSHTYKEAGIQQSSPRN